MMHSPPVVLVVHPEGEARTALYALLAAEGHAVATLGTGFEALGYASRHRPAAIIASARLPDMSLTTFLEELERAGVGSTTVLLAHADDWELFADSEGSTQVLRWPGRKEELQAAVERCFAGAGR